MSVSPLSITTTSSTLCLLPSDNERCQIPIWTSISMLYMQRHVAEDRDSAAPHIKFPKVPVWSDNPATAKEKEAIINRKKRNKEEGNVCCIRFLYPIGSSNSKTRKEVNVIDLKYLSYRPICLVLWSFSDSYHYLQQHLFLSRRMC